MGVENVSIGDILIALISILSSIGFWQFMQARSKLNHQKTLNRDQADSEFKESLKRQVSILTEKVDKLLEDKIELLQQMSTLQTNLIKAEQTIKHLEETLRRRVSNHEDR